MLSVSVSGCHVKGKRAAETLPARLRVDAKPKPKPKPKELRCQMDMDSDGHAPSTLQTPPTAESGHWAWSAALVGCIIHFAAYLVSLILVM